MKGEKRKRATDFISKNRENLTDLIVLVLIICFIASFFKPELMLSNTTTSGGDTGSHNYPAFYMKEYLLPEGKLIDWSPGWYAGIPIFQFYFPIPYLIMAMLGYATGLQVSFKIVTVLGTFLLPLCAYLSTRLMKFRFPVPALAAIFTLPFLFMEANSMWGGNIPSTLAGEFSYSLSLSLMVLFVGSVYRGLEDKKHTVWNGLLLALVGLTHVYTLLLGISVAAFLILSKDKKKILENLKYLFFTFLLAFMIMGFWVLPLFSKIHYKTDFNFVWTINEIGQVFPEILLPFFALAVLSLALSLKSRDRKVWYLCLVVPLSFILYLAGPKMGLADIRFVPFIQLFPLIIGSYSAGELARRLRFREIFPIIAVLIVLIWVNSHVTYIDDWIKWNYSGFEEKASYGQLKELTEYLAGLPYGRVVHEFSGSHNKFGTVRTLENIPMFTGKPVLEGLYIESGLSSPFVFYIQSEISETPTCPLPGLKCSWFGLENGTKHLKLFNVDYLVATSEKLKQPLRASPEWTFMKGFGDIDVWRLNNTGNYVQVPEYEPVLVITDEWKDVSMEWFRELDFVDVPLVFKTKLDEGDSDSFRYVMEEWDITKIEKIPLERCSVEENYSANEIRIITDCIGKPLWVKVSYFPNWKAEGADIYLASPSFMIVYPRQENVRIYYGDTVLDVAGALMSYLGIAIVLVYALMKLTKLKPEPDQIQSHDGHVEKAEG